MGVRVTGVSVEIFSHIFDEGLYEVPGKLSLQYLLLSCVHPLINKNPSIKTARTPVISQFFIIKLDYYISR